MGGSITEQLENFFEEWIKEQKKDNEYDCEKTGIAIDSFTQDGVVDEDTWNALKPKKKVLYLLREANGNTSKKDADGKGACVDDGEFWFKQCVNDGNIGNKIFKRIAGMQRIIQNDDKSSDTDLLKQVAYMNINKRGGGSKVDWKMLTSYANDYEEFIKKEICIIKPDIIVCCGTYWLFVDNICGFYKNNDRTKNWESGAKEDFVLDETVRLENDECKCKIINMYHPSAIMSIQNYIDRFKQLWKCCNNNENMEKTNDLPNKDDIIKFIIDLDEKSEQYFDLCELIGSMREDLE